MTTSAGAPTGVQQGFFVGQFHFQTGTSPFKIWFCTAIGTPGTWIELAQAFIQNISYNAIFNNGTAIQFRDSLNNLKNGLLLDGTDVFNLGDSTITTLRLLTVSLTGLKARVSGVDYTVWHAGNDGAGSGLAADDTNSFQGQLPTDFVRWSAGQFLEVLGGSPALNSSQSLVHGFGARPRLFQVVLRCTIAEGSYGVDDEIKLDSWYDSTNNRGVTINSDSVNAITVSWHGANFPVVANGGGSSLTINPANWRVVLRAWK